jgi:hypothetical protein
MTTFVKLYVQGKSSKMPVVYDRFGTNGLKSCFFKEILLRVGDWDVNSQQEVGCVMH